ncbi:hypothetical protein J2W56_000550 [Nocardia kruczakiae]|uniref:Uncharacterized protein n=1 Tax=Nocardia kruczakiae TaxID=261477 RepID=A0ABU1X9U0_9NOCA|nr:DUF2000 family protein [Nocardia kruczakiae]MDR7166832.1 hypothetical protein [Nocardia kruczakiae]
MSSSASAPRPEKMAATPTTDLVTVGVGLHGGHTHVDELVGSLPLFG